MTFCWCSLAFFVRICVLLRVLTIIIHIVKDKSKRVILSFLDSLVLGINNLLNSLFGFSYGYSIVFMNSSGDDENESSQRPSSITGSTNESNPQPSENNGAESDSEGEAENSENDDILSDVSEDSGLGHLLPEANDLEVAERAANGDPDAINEIQEKYPAFFDHQSSTEKGIKEVIEYIEEEIRTDYQWGQGGPWTGGPGPSAQNDDQSSSSPESSVTEAGPSGTSNEQSSGSNNPNDSLTGNGELNPSHKRARSESESVSEEGPENKKTKTKNNDDDDSNNNPPKGGGSLGGGPSEGGGGPSEGGNSPSSNLNESSSNSVSKFEIILVNIGFILEEIFKNMYPPF